MTSSIKSLLTQVADLEQAPKSDALEATLRACGQERTRLYMVLSFPADGHVATLEEQSDLDTIAQKIKALRQRHGFPLPPFTQQPATAEIVGRPRSVTVVGQPPAAAPVSALLQRDGLGGLPSSSKSLAAPAAPEPKKEALPTADEPTAQKDAEIEEIQKNMPLFLASIEHTINTNPTFYNLSQQLRTAKESLDKLFNTTGVDLTKVIQWQVELNRLIDLRNAKKIIRENFVYACHNQFEAAEIADAGDSRNPDRQKNLARNRNACAGIAAKALQDLCSPAENLQKQTLFSTGQAIAQRTREGLGKPDLLQLTPEEVYLHGNVSGLTLFEDRADNYREQMILAKKPVLAKGLFKHRLDNLISLRAQKRERRLGVFLIVGDQIAALVINDKNEIEYFDSHGWAGVDERSLLLRFKTTEKAAAFLSLRYGYHEADDIKEAQDNKSLQTKLKHENDVKNTVTFLPAVFKRSNGVHPRLSGSDQGLAQPPAAAAQPQPAAAANANGVSMPAAPAQPVPQAASQSLAAKKRALDARRTAAVPAPAEKTAVAALQPLLTVAEAAQAEKFNQRTRELDQTLSKLEAAVSARRPDVSKIDNGIGALHTALEEQQNKALPNQRGEGDIYDTAPIVAQMERLEALENLWKAKKSAPATPAVPQSLPSAQPAPEAPSQNLAERMRKLKGAAPAAQIQAVKPPIASMPLAPAQPAPAKRPVGQPSLLMRLPEAAPKSKPIAAGPKPKAKGWFGGLFNRSNKRDLTKQQARRLMSLNQDDDTDLFIPPADIDLPLSANNGSDDGSDLPQL